MSVDANGVVRKLRVLYVHTLNTAQQGQQEHHSHLQRVLRRTLLKTVECNRFSSFDGVARGVYINTDVILTAQIWYAHGNGSESESHSYATRPTFICPREDDVTLNVIGRGCDENLQYCKLLWILLANQVLM